MRRCCCGCYPYAAESASIVVSCSYNHPHVAASLGSVAYACREQVSGAEVVIPGTLDLAKPESIHRFVSHYRQQKYSCDILVNNAGAAYRREWYTEEGVAGLTQVCLKLHTRTLKQSRAA